MDSYDAMSVSFGIYFDSKLIAAMRLVYASTLETLPSYAFIPSSHRSSQGARFAEISRAIVARAYRGLHLFHILNLAVNTHVEEQRCSAVVVSAPECLRFRRYWEKLGFTMINTGFDFQDEKIHPDCIASTYSRAILPKQTTEPNHARITLITNELSNAARIVAERQ